MVTIAPPVSPQPFPGVEKADLYQFLALAREDEVEAEKAWRQRLQAGG